MKLRERREWLDVLDNIKGGEQPLSDAATFHGHRLSATRVPDSAGLSTKGLIELRSEAKAPFRLTRMIITGGIAAAAVISLIVTLTRLPAALKGERLTTLMSCVFPAVQFARPQQIGPALVWLGSVFSK